MNVNDQIDSFFGIAAKEPARQQIAQDTKVFIDNGGQIEIIEMGHTTMTNGKKQDNEYFNTLTAKYKKKLNATKKYSNATIMFKNRSYIMVINDKETVLGANEKQVREKVNELIKTPN